MKITWFCHSAFRVETANSVILIDPFLSGSPTFEGSLDEAMDGCTHVVLTHGHDDHVGDTVDICKKTGAKLVAIFEICTWLSGKGVENIDPTNTGGTVDQGDFTVSFVNALHSSGTSVDGQMVYLGNPCGVVIKAGGKTLYHMGDTEIFSDMKLINDIHKPQTGIVPIGDRFTMGARTAAMACKSYFDFDTVIPCHYGTFPIIDQTPDAFLAEMKGENVKALALGESIEV